MSNKTNKKQEEERWQQWINEGGDGRVPVTLDILAILVIVAAFGAVFGWWP